MQKKTKQNERKILIDIAKKLFAEGFTTREIGAKIKKSHAWVAEVVKENLLVENSGT